MMQSFCFKNICKKTSKPAVFFTETKVLNNQAKIVLYKLIAKLSIKLIFEQFISWKLI